MNALKKKLNKNSGFTLVEMLIVVAIIAILIAVSIPLVNSALERSRDATDQANERAAKAAAAIILLQGADADAESETDEDEAALGAQYEALVDGDGLNYDAVKGVLLDEGEDPGDGYGKCKGQDSCYTAGDEAKNIDHTGMWINISYNTAEEEYVITWTNGSTGD